MLAIVGAGLSGAAVARELDGRGVEYLLLEAGPDLGTAHVGAAAETEGLADPAADPSFRPFDGSPGSPYGPLAGYRARVGGRGLYWRGICLRIEERALADWPEPVRRALEERWYPEVEEELARWSGGALAAPRSADEERLLAEVEKAGHRAVPTPRAVRFGEGGRWSAYAPVGAVDPARIRADSRVSRIAARPGGGFLLDLPGERLAADGVVLAAGLFENARLVDGLLGRRGELRIVDHVASGFVAVRPGVEHGPRDASVYAGFHPAASSNLFVESLPAEGGTLLDAWAMGEQVPEAAGVLAEGRVSLDGPARVLLDAVTGGQRELLARLAEGLGLGAVRGAGPGFDEALARAAAEPGMAVGYLAGIGELDHESSGLALGGALVDEAGALRAAPGVHVVGPCLFPRAGAANPTLTSLALARYVAGSVASRI
ncbi:FAD-dependent oxidoreductase [Kitasatospora sp. NPDC051853]|uniref:FAD-dependent oxidoreductase n=1 Tax=Kitasatospora sp. NPDC051853 TaxID=3364058 RepID=UPI0037AB67D9